MSASMPLQLLGKNGNQYEVITTDIFRILDKIGDKNVAIVTINGNKRTGKSFLLNYFVRYLKYNKLYGNEWINGVNEETLKGFHWRGGAERDTVGIWMWSEPFMVKDKYGNDIALLLMNTQGNFDEKTTFQECSVIFSLSLLMSTTLILNIKYELSEDILQFVEYFTTFAESFSGESQSNGALFQKLVFLVRDWENDCDYPFGYHDQYMPVSKNFMKDVVIPNTYQFLEAQNTRKEIMRYFTHVCVYLMPHPGKYVSKRTFKGQIELMEREFDENIANFVPIMLENDKIEPKTIGGQILTGNILKQYISKWAEVIKTLRIPETKSLFKATSEVNYKMALKHSIKLYNTNMCAFIDSKPSDQQLCSYHETAKQKSLKYYMNEPKGRITEDRKVQMIEDLENCMEQAFVILRRNNNCRIDKEESELNLNAGFAKHLQMNGDMEEYNCESKKKIANFQNRASNVKHDSNITHFKKDWDKMMQNMDLQNSEHIKMMADLEQTHSQQIDEFITNDNEIFEQKKLPIEDISKRMYENIKKPLVEEESINAMESKNAKKMVFSEKISNEETKRKINEISRKTFTARSRNNNSSIMDPITRNILIIIFGIFYKYYLPEYK